MRMTHFLAVATVLAVVGSALAQTTRWQEAVSGLWRDVERWDNGPPGPGATVVIEAVGNSYTATMEDNFSIDGLVLDAPGARLQLRGRLDLAGTATMRRGILGGFGVIRGGRLVLGAPEDLLIQDLALDGVTVAGDLFVDDDLSPQVYHLPGTRIEGTVHLRGQNADLVLQGDQVFAGQIRQSVRRGRLALADAPVSVTLSESTTIEGRDLEIGSLVPPRSGFLTELINHGSIVGNVAFSPGVEFRRLTRLENNGTIAGRSGGGFWIDESVDHFVNRGLVEIGAGAFGAIQAQTWENAGEIRVAEDGHLTLYNDLDNSGLTQGRITGDASSSLFIRGDFDNTNRIFRTDSFPGLLRFDSGTLLSGTLQTTDPADYDFRDNGGFLLRGVSVAGDLDLDTRSAKVRVADGLRVSGTVALSGDYTDMVFSGDQVFYGDMVGGGRNADVLLTRSTRLTVGPDSSLRGGLRVYGSHLPVEQSFNNLGTIEGGVTIDGLTEVINTGLFSAQGDQRITIGDSVDYFRNEGRVEVDGGGSVTVAAESWRNDGEIEIGVGSLSISSDFITAQSGLTSGGIKGGPDAFLSFSGEVDNRGETIRLSDFGGTVVLCDTLLGGTFETGEGQRLAFPSCPVSRLDGVDLRGDLRLASEGGRLAFANGTSLTGTMHWPATGVSLRFVDTFRLDWDVVQDGGGEIVLNGPDARLTIAENTTVRANSLAIEAAAGQQVFHRGTLVVSDLLSVRGDGAFENHGRMHFQPDTEGVINVGQFVNNGAWEVDPNSEVVVLTPGWQNVGMLVLNDGAIELRGDCSATAIGLNHNRIVGSAASSLTIRQATLDNSDQVLSTDDFAGVFRLDEGALMGGVWETNDANRYDFSRSRLNRLLGVEVRGDLVLDTPDAAIGIGEGTTVTGTIHQRAATTEFRLFGGQTFAGTMRQTEGLGRFYLSGDQEVFRFAETALLEGGSLDLGGAPFSRFDQTLINDGTIRAIERGTSTLGTRIWRFQTLTNNGSLEAVRGGRLSVGPISPEFTNLVDGTLTGGRYLADGAEMDLGGPVVTNRAEIEVRGHDANFVGLEALESNDGRLTLGRGAELVLPQGIALGAESVLRVEITGRGDAASVPRLASAGDVDLGGTLILDFSSFSPRCVTPDHVFTVIEGVGFEGAFATILIEGIDPNAVQFDAPGVFRLTPTPCRSDANVDGTVDLLDLLLVLSEFGLTATGLDGDLDCDGSIGLADVAILLAEFDTACP